MTVFSDLYAMGIVTIQRIRGYYFRGGMELNKRLIKIWGAEKDTSSDPANVNVSVYWYNMSASID